MSIRSILRSILKKLGDIFLIKNEYVFRPKGSDVPVYIIGEGVYRTKLEDLYRSPQFREDLKALDKKVMENWELGEDLRKKKEAAEAAEAGETQVTVQKNSLSRPEGAD